MTCQLAHFQHFQRSIRLHNLINLLIVSFTNVMYFTLTDTHTCVYDHIDDIFIDNDAHCHHLA